MSVRVTDRRRRSGTSSSRSPTPILSSSNVGVGFFDKLDGTVPGPRIVSRFSTLLRLIVFLTENVRMDTLMFFRINIMETNFMWELYSTNQPTHQPTHIDQFS